MGGRRLATSYIEAQVARTNRNLLLINGFVLAIFALFGLFMLLGAALIMNSGSRLQAAIAGQGDATDLGHPQRVSPADLGSTGRLQALLGHAVTLTDPGAEDMHFPVYDWMGRATGPERLH